MKIISLFLTTVIQLLFLHYTPHFGFEGIMSMLLILSSLIIGLYYFCTRPKQHYMYQIGWGILLGSISTISIVVTLAYLVIRRYNQ